MSAGKTPLPTGSADDKLLAKAVVVTAVEVHVHPATLDRVFVVHSESREPITLLVPALAMPGILRDLAEAVTRAMN